MISTECYYFHTIVKSKNRKSGTICISLELNIMMKFLQVCFQLIFIFKTRLYSISLYGINQFYYSNICIFLMLKVPSVSSKALRSSFIIFAGPFIDDWNKSLTCVFVVVVVETHVSRLLNYELIYIKHL